MKITCIGTGSMGGAIMRAVCKKFDPKTITVTNRTAEKGIQFAAENGCNFCSSNVDAVKDAKYIFLAVKPIALEDLFKEINPYIPDNAVVISMAAGTKIERLEHIGENVRFVRIMPNVPAQIGQAMTAICCNDDIEESELKEITEILSSCGKVEQVPEKLMDCVTAVSGSGPAFVFMFIEAMADGAVKMGIPRAKAYKMAAQSVLGSAKMVLETGKHPGELKDMVCSPAGTTIEAVEVLESLGFRNAAMQAVIKCSEKSKNM